MKIIREIQTYWDARAAGFSAASEEELKNEPGTRVQQLFETRLAPPPGRVLDCGAGAGFFSVLLAKLGYTVDAVDYCSEMLKKANANLTFRGLGASFAQMDAQALAYTDGVFDAIVTRNLIWNLENPEKVYSEFARLLKPGGVLLVEDGNYYLYLLDANYAALMQPEKHTTCSGGCHGRHNVDNVDFSIMENIALGLPLSGIRRPQWDFDQLTGLGFSRVNVEIGYRENGTEKLPVRFLITAEK